MRKLCGVVAVVLALAGWSCSKDPEVEKRRFVESGDRYVAAKDYQAAIIQYRNAVALDGNLGEARYKLALAYVAIDGQSSALREAVRAADLLPNSLGAQLLAGKLLLSTRQATDAKERALKALAVDPTSVEAMLLLGNSLAGLRDLDGAIEQVEQAIEQDPSASFAYANLGVLQLAKGEQSAAEAAMKRAVAAAPASVDAHLSLANFYWAVGRSAEAEVELKTAGGLDARSQVANRALAAFYMLKGDGQQTEFYLKRYAELAPTPANELLLADYYLLHEKPGDALSLLTALEKRGDVPGTLRLAQLDFKAGRKPAAYERVASLLKNHPNNELVLETRARFLVHDGNFQEALKTTNTVLQANPKARAATFLKGVALEGLGQSADALAAYQELLKLDPASMVAKEKIAEVSLKRGDARTATQFASQLARVKSTVGAHVLLAKSLLMDGKLSQAESELATLAKQAPDDPTVQATLGAFYLRKRDASRARQAFERALRAQPDLLEALGGLTALDVAEKKPDAAVERVERQLRERPDNPALLEVAATTYLMAERPKDAETALRKVIEVDPNNLTAYTKLAVLYMRQRRLDEALKSFKDVAAKTSSPAGPRTMVGVIYMVQSKLEDARQEFQAALAANPNASVAANNLAWIYAEKGENLDVALNLAQRAKAGLPNNGLVSDTLGWVYYRKGLAELAVASLHEAITQNPGNAESHYRLGLALIAAKREQEAKASLNQALRLNPSFPAADEARRLLGSIG